jgi:hypothetical protein
VTTKRAERYREAAEDALGQLDWCIGYLHGIRKPQISAQLATRTCANRHRGDAWRAPDFGNRLPTRVDVVRPLFLECSRSDTPANAPAAADPCGWQQLPDFGRGATLNQQGRGDASMEQATANYSRWPLPGAALGEPDGALLEELVHALVGIAS